MKREYLFWNKYDNSVSKVCSICKESGGIVLEGGKFGNHSAQIKDGVLLVYYEKYEDNFKKLEEIIKKGLSDKT